MLKLRRNYRRGGRRCWASVVAFTHGSLSGACEKVPQVPICCMIAVKSFQHMFERPIQKAPANLKVTKISGSCILPCQITFSSTNNFLLSPGSLLTDSPLPFRISTFMAPVYKLKEYQCWGASNLKFYQIIIIFLQAFYFFKLSKFHDFPWP